MNKADQMTAKDFAQMAYEAAIKHKQQGLINGGFTYLASDLCITFDELPSEEQESWIHGCAVALAEYKKQQKENK